MTSATSGSEENDPDVKNDFRVFRSTHVRSTLTEKIIIKIRCRISFSSLISTISSLLECWSKSAAKGQLTFYHGRWGGQKASVRVQSRKSIFILFFFCFCFWLRDMQLDQLLNLTLFLIFFSFFACFQTSNLVLSHDKNLIDYRSRNDPTGEVQSLSGHLEGTRMGDRFQRGRAPLQKDDESAAKWVSHPLSRTCEFLVGAWSREIAPSIHRFDVMVSIRWRGFA